MDYLNLTGQHLAKIRGSQLITFLKIDNIFEKGITEEFVRDPWDLKNSRLV